MTMRSAFEGEVADELGRHWKWLMALGVLSLIGGIFAIFYPLIASISAAILCGWALLFGAVAQGMAAFRGRSGGERAKHGLLALLYAVAGLYLLLFPVSGTITLTVVLVAWLFATGVVQLIAAFQGWGVVRGAGWMILSGIVSIILGVLIWADLPSSATWAIGLLVGIELLFGGWDLIFLALAARSVDHTLAAGRTRPPGSATPATP
jgi:uncharacterized membrane protein HdeD (DUF308 family)